MPDAFTRATPRIVGLIDLAEEAERLRLEAKGEGFRFLDTLVGEWRSGANRFSGPGEVLLGAYRGAGLVAIGGLNRDPYTSDADVGRLRHLYVGRSVRRTGVGTALVRELIRHARGSFVLVRLRTTTPDAARFYAALGFRTVRDATATHVRNP